jgi:hypothetical protein
MTPYLGAEGRRRQTGEREGHVAGCRYSGCAPPKKARKSGENDFAFNHLLIAGAVFFVFKKW